MSSEGIADTPRELPESWIETTLGDALKVVGGGTPSASDPSNFSEIDGVPWITPADLSGYRNMYISRGRRNLSQKGYEASSAIILPSGSVVYSSRAPIGYVAIASNDISTNQGFKSFIIPEGIYNKFLYFYLKSIKDIAEQNATGTTFKELSGSAAALLPLVLPPLAEQVRIAEKLDALLARVEAGRERLERVPKLLKRFRQSVLSAAVGGELTREWREAEGKQWHSTTYRIGDIGHVVTGGTPKADVRGGEGTVPFFKPSELDNGYNVTTAKELVTESAAMTVRPIPSRSVMVTCIGATIGKVGFSRVAGITNQQINSVVCNESLVSPEYLYFQLTSEFGQSSIIDNASSTTMPILNKSRFSDLQFDFPLLDEQAEIVRRIEALFAIADRVEAKYAAALSSFDRLTPALLAKAFRGELVPQDPDDEPASVLLERIRAARADTTKKPRQARAGSAAGAGETGKRGRGRPRKTPVAPQDGLFTDVPEAASVQDAVAQLEARKVQRRVVMLQEVAQQAVRAGRQLAVSEVYRQFRSAFPDDDVSDFYVALRQVSPELMGAVQPDTLWENAGAD